jgi:inner membrane protein
MASLFAHAAIPLIAKGTSERRQTITLLALSMWPDLDWLGLAFEVRPNEMLGHRGVTHSLLAAMVSAAIAAIVLRSRSQKDWLFLFGVAASHGLVDTITAGDVGVAWFAPLSNVRLSLPIIPSCPMGLDEWLGPFGVLTLANEILYIVLPLALVVGFVRAGASRRRLAAIGAVWLALAVVLRTAWPTSFSPRVPRVMQPIGSLEGIPADDLPEKKLVTRLSDFRALGLLDKTLEPSTPAWSSSFFPSWFGAESGRWQDGAPKLVWRTLFGTRAATETEARGMMFGLSPTEKVDFAFGRFDFPATNDALSFTHNARPRPRYWFGRCSGVSGAAVNFPEPFRVVDVTAVDGSHVRFHPNDIKSLLAIAYSKPERYTVVGDECTTVAFDSGAVCSMSPALLIVAVLNRIGIAKQSLVVDAVPTPANQYYAIASAKVHVDPDGHFAIDLVLSSTTLAYSRANVLDPSDPSGSTYRHVGVVPVPMSYEGTLALDPQGELIGGTWKGDGPDNAVVISQAPALGSHCTLLGASFIAWPFLRELARASAGDGPAALDVRTECDGRCKCDTP